MLCWGCGENSRSKVKPSAPFLQNPHILQVILFYRLGTFDQYIREFAMIPSRAAVGILIIAVATSVYSIAQNYMGILSAESFVFFESLAYLYFVTLLAGMLITVLGLYTSLKRKAKAMRDADEIPLKLSSALPYMFLDKQVGRVFAVASLLYGLFYSFITSMIIYRPDMRFSEAYLTSIPSVAVSPCCGPPGQVPVLVGYLTENVGLLVVPLTLLLLITISGLVALNVSLTYYAWKNRPSFSKQGWTVGLAASIGLFTGCPTCAGLFLASMVGGVGATTLSVSLAPLQSLFIALTIPVLLATPYLILGNIAKSVGGSCLRPKPLHAQV